jgi:hypothetical protein
MDDCRLQSILSCPAENSQQSSNRSINNQQSTINNNTGQAPSGFSDFSAINLNARRVGWLPAPGLQLNNGRTFRFQQLTVKREKFTFITTQVRGVSYSFSGRFLKGGVFAETVLDDQSPVLEGVLTKFVSGKKVAETKLQFGYFGGA